jgi:phospho-N-acetylmuramoyl-pentapeptide-transferase
MLVKLFQWLEQFNPDFSVFGYITLRSILSALTALALSLLLGRRRISPRLAHPPWVAP